MSLDQDCGWGGGGEAFILSKGFEHLRFGGLTYVGELTISNYTYDILLYNSLTASFSKSSIFLCFMRRISFALCRSFLELVSSITAVFMYSSEALDAINSNSL